MAENYAANISERSEIKRRGPSVGPCGTVVCWWLGNSLQSPKGENEM